MSQPIQLIVGLANPGKEYENTRHNAGAWFIQEITNAFSTNLRAEPKFHGLYGQAKIHGQNCHLLIPTTYMNLSGQAVRACMNYFKLPNNAILIAHDEMDLPAGTVKLKYDGGDGGHNGLKDIISHLHTKQFYRLRIGVSRPPRNSEVIDYVLNPPSKADSAKIFTGLEGAMSALPLILEGEMQKAMQQLHSNQSEPE